MSRLLVIMVAVLPALASMQSVVLSVCECCVQGGSAAEASVASSDRDGCCGLETGSAPTDHEDRPADLPCSDDDCPRSCCSVVKAPVHAESAPPVRAMAEPREHLSPGDPMRVASAHLDRLPKPPRHAKSV